MLPLDTGAGGGTIIEFAWSSDDPLSGNLAPAKYARADIDYGGDGLASGVILKSAPARDKETNDEVDGVFILSISVGAPHARPLAAAISDGYEIGVRVYG